MCALTIAGAPLDQGASVRDAVAWAAALLAVSQSDTPRLDAEVLLAFGLRLSRAQLHAHWLDALDDTALRAYAALIHRRRQHEPVAYLVGERAFYDVDIYVTRDVLIPRPESEHLVEQVLAWVRARPDPHLRALDVGTGSGALALSLTRHLPDAQVWALDLSVAALCVARRNLAHYDLAQRVNLVCGDLLGCLVGPFDVIVANLPYIPRSDLMQLAPDVIDYEPRLALDGGADGLDLIRRLLLQAPTRLSDSALMLLEIDPRQRQEVTRLARDSFTDAEITTHQDYAGLDRVVRIERRAPSPAGFTE